MTRIRPLAAAFLLACLGNAAQAHQIWIENDGGRVHLNFGENVTNLREITPGRLDEFIGIPTMEARVNGKTEAVTGGKLTPEYFFYTADPNADTLFADGNHPPILRTAKNQPPLGWHLAARWVANPELAVPARSTALDLVPTGKAGEVRAVFQGKPLPKARITFLSPSGWAREQNTSADGTAQFDLPWKGQYEAIVHYTDENAGEQKTDKGEKYNEAFYVTTLTFVQPTGAMSPSPLPVHSSQKH